MDLTKCLDWSSKKLMSMTYFISTSNSVRARNNVRHTNICDVRFKWATRNSVTDSSYGDRCRKNRPKTLKCRLILMFLDDFNRMSTNGPGHSLCIYIDVLQYILYLYILSDSTMEKHVCQPLECTVNHEIRHLFF